MVSAAFKYIPQTTATTFAFSYLLPSSLGVSFAFLKCVDRLWPATLSWRLSCRPRTAPDTLSCGSWGGGAGCAAPWTSCRTVCTRRSSPWCAPAQYRDMSLRKMRGYCRLQHFQNICHETSLGLYSLVSFTTVNTVTKNLNLLIKTESVTAF